MSWEGNRGKSSQSYGILCWYWDVTCGWRICLIQRRVSYALCSFVDGKYKKDSDWQSLLQRMTSDELLLVRVGNYKNLWIQVWLSDPESTTTFPRFLTNYKVQREKFQAYFGRDNYKKLQNFIDHMKVSTHNHLWGLPKGHKESGAESDLQAALREYREETDMPLANIRIINRRGAPCLTFHNFIGSDSIKYNYTFYNALYVGIGPPSSARVTNSYEIKNIVWAPINMVKLLAPDIYRKIQGACRVVNLTIGGRAPIVSAPRHRPRTDRNTYAASTSEKNKNSNTPIEDNNETIIIAEDADISQSLGLESGD